MKDKAISRINTKKVGLISLLGCLVVAAAIVIAVNINRQNKNDPKIAKLVPTQEESSQTEETSLSKQAQAESQETSENVSIAESAANLKRLKESEEASIAESAALAEAAAVEASVAESIAASQSAELQKEEALALLEETTAAVPETEPVTEPAMEETVNAIPLQFDEESVMCWPVSGEVVQMFSPNETVWFPTLRQYKTSHAIEISAEAGVPVVAAADGCVTEVGYNEEIGNYLVMDVGNGYTAKYGNLENITTPVGTYVKANAAFASLSRPTAYYSVEGSNLYFRIAKDGVDEDPLNFIK